MPLRIDPDDDTIVFVAAQAISLNGSVIFVSTGHIRLEVSSEGRQTTEELLDQPVDATPEFYLNVRHGRGPEVLQFNRDKLRELVARFQTANHIASGNGQRNAAEFKVSISIPLYVVDATSQTFIIGRWLTSEPLLVRIVDGRLTLIGYYADRFLGGTLGLRRMDSDR